MTYTTCFNEEKVCELLNTFSTKGLSLDNVKIAHTGDYYTIFYPSYYLYDVVSQRFKV